MNMHQKKIISLPILDQFSSITRIQVEYMEADENTQITCLILDPKQPTTQKTYSPAATCAATA